MSTIFNLACTASAWCPVEHPDTNYHGAAQYALAGTSEGAKPYYTYLLLKFEDIPEAYRYNTPVNATYHITANRNLPGKTVPIAFRALLESFDEQSVTYETVPRSVTGWYGIKMTTAGTGDEDLEWTARTQDTTDYLATNQCAVQALQSRAVEVYCSDSVSSGYLKAYTENETASEKRPYLKIAMGDTPVYCDTEITEPNYGTTYRKDAPIEVTWDIKFRSYTGLMPIVQTSALIEWRVSGSTDEKQTITVQGDVRSFTFPANTFPASDIELWVTPTLVGYNVKYGYKTFHIRNFYDVSPSGIAWIQAAFPDTAKPWTGNGVISFFSNSLAPSRNDLILEFSGNYSNIAHKAIAEAAIVFKTGVNAGESKGVYLFFNSSPFNAEAVTWNTQPAVGRVRGSGFCNNREGTRYLIIDEFNLKANSFENGVVPTTTRLMSELAAEMLTAPGFHLKATYTQSDSESDYNSFYISEPLFLRAYYLDLTVTSKPQAAKFASGYVNRHVAQIFAWDLVPDGDYYCFGDWTQTLANFYYRAGTSGNWTLKQITGAEQSVELAANTLAAGTVQWKVQTTDDQGTTAESEVYEITTTDSATAATPITPYNTIENGDAAIVFEWETSNDHGTAPTGADLQYSTDGSSWSDLGSVSGAATEYSAAAETFTNGTVYWRVRAYNADSVAGSWSDPVSFVCMAAPPAPVVSATEVPFATISWQGDGQQAYRITVDGKSYGPYFGTVKSFDLPDYLTDGQHTATVEVQGSSGLWSHPGSITFSVTNVPGDPVALTGKYSRDAALTWTTDSATADFYIYRDDVRIGHATGTRFTDRFVLGAHSYYVVNKLPGGYYTRSNLSSGAMRSCTRAVAAFAGGGWLEMALSDDSDTEENFSWTMTASERHVTGAAWPVVERSPYTDGSGSYRISFADVETGAAFEALRGQRIIVKSRGGNVVIGVMTGYQKTMTNFYLTYVFTVRRCDWRDYIDAGD